MLMIHSHTGIRHGNVQRGFTLIEITIAILVLAGSLVVLLGLQSSALTRTYRDEQGLRAMQGARILLAGIESSQVPLNDGVSTTSLVDLMAEYSDINAQDPEIATFSDLQATLSIEPFGIGPLEDSTMKRISLKIFWGPSDLDALNVFYISPIIPEKDG